jgi:hypothetical protein
MAFTQCAIGGSAKPWWLLTTVRVCTPAIAAGIENHIWTLRDIAALLD